MANAIMNDEFTEAEKSMLRYLEERFIAFGGQPKTLTDSVTKDAFLHQFPTVDEVSYRRFIARLQARGIAHRAAAGAQGEWISIGPEIVDVVRELDGVNPPPRTLADETMSGLVPMSLKSVPASGSRAKPMSKNFPGGWVRGDHSAKAVKLRSMSRPARATHPDRSTRSSCFEGESRSQPTSDSHERSM